MAFNKQVQLIGISPDELKTQILEGVESQIEDLKKSFQPKEPTELLTRREVAELLKIDISTVHNWTKAGKLIPYGLQGRVYYKRNEVESALIALNS